MHRARNFIVCTLLMISALGAPGVSSLAQQAAGLRERGAHGEWIAFRRCHINRRRARFQGRSVRRAARRRFALETAPAGQKLDGRAQG